MGNLLWLFHYLIRAGHILPPLHHIIIIRIKLAMILYLDRSQSAMIDDAWVMVSEFTG